MEDSPQLSGFCSHIFWTIKERVSRLPHFGENELSWGKTVERCLWTGCPRAGVSLRFCISFLTSPNLLKSDAHKYITKVCEEITQRSRVPLSPIKSRTGVGLKGKMGRSSRAHLSGNAELKWLVGTTLSGIHRRWNSSRMWHKSLYSFFPNLRGHNDLS